MAGEHINVLMAAGAPAKRAFAVDRHGPKGWVEVAEFASLQGAQDARDRIVGEGLLARDEIRVRGERGRRTVSRVRLGILAVLAAANAFLYAVIMSVE